MYEAWWLLQNRAAYGQRASVLPNAVHLLLTQDQEMNRDAMRDGVQTELWLHYCVEHHRALATVRELRINDEVYWGPGKSKVVVSRKLLVELAISILLRLILGCKTNRQWRDTCPPKLDENLCRLELDFQVLASQQ